MNDVVNSELRTCGVNLISQTQSNPSANRFRILLKAIRPGVGWVWLAKLHERLPCPPRQLLFQCENGNCADPFAVMPGCQEGTLGSSTFDERYRPYFLLVMLLLCILVCSLPHPSHTRQLEKGGPEYRGHSQCGANSKKEA